MIGDISQVDLLALVSRDVPLKRKASTNGGEWEGPCPFCRTGHDRFLVWPNHPSGRGRYWCRICKRRGDAIQYVRERDGLSYAEACERLGVEVAGAFGQSQGGQPQGLPRPCHEPLASPGREWQARGRAFVEECQAALWKPRGARPLGWLRKRRLADATIRAAGLGYNPVDRWDKRERWGLPPDEQGKGLWLPRGIIIPWVIGGELWRMNIRRPAGEPRYYQPAGGAVGLYNADALRGDQPAVLCEGEVNALTVNQYAGDLVAAAATGSTDGARRARWIARLALTPLVLVAFDVDANGAGDVGADYWLRVLSNARRWRPYWSDVNEMAQDGADVRAWVTAGLAHYGGCGQMEMITMVWPPDSPIGCPVGRWRRQENGEIEARYTRVELKLALALATALEG